MDFNDGVLLVFLAAKEGDHFRLVQPFFQFVALCFQAVQHFFELVALGFTAQFKQGFLILPAGF